MNLGLVKIRSYEPDDKNFIYTSWLRGLRFGNDFFREIDSDVYYREMQKTVDTILALKDTKVDVACLIEDPRVILGYVVNRPDVLDWVFVKLPWRRMGVARTLLKDKEIKFVSNITIVGDKIRKKKGWVFNPFE